MSTAKERLDKFQAKSFDEKWNSRNNKEKKKKKFKLPGEFPGTKEEFNKKYGVKENKNKLKKKSSKKKASKPNLVQTPSPTWGVKKKKEKKVENKETPKVKKKITARSRMEARNREIHGDDAIDALKKKNKAFQAAKKKKGGMKEFAKNFPNSQTAKRRKLKIATWRDVE